MSDPDRRDEPRRDEPLRVGIVAPPWVPVPPPVYGGTELVVDVLARGLVAAGHEVQLFTTGDATCPVPRRWLYPWALGTAADRDLELGHVIAAYQQLHDVDVVHDQTALGPAWADAHRPDLRVVTTVHDPFTARTAGHYQGLAQRMPVIAVSHDQRRRAPDVPVTAVIHHGVELDAIPVGDGTGGHLVFLGRMSPDKGVHRAIRVARAVGLPLVIAAKMWEPAEKVYFERVVAPLLGDDVTYVGQVGPDDKYALLGSAVALLNPIRWPEPFGLVMAEALACGTPVLTFAEGAAPEIVEHGRTGFLCDDEDDMVRRLADVGRLERGACRASAEQRFSSDRFVAEHVELYRQVLVGARAPACG